MVLLTTLYSCLSLIGLAAGDGPGLGNIPYTTGEIGTTLCHIDTTNGAPRGHGIVAMHRGRMWVPFSDDGGGGGTSGGFAVYEVANPRAPVNVFTTIGKPAYQAGGAHNSVVIRETHSINITGDTVCLLTNGTGATGLQMWNWSDALAPQRLSQFLLPGLNGGDYDSTPWWAAMQGRNLVYVAGAGNGLYVVDISNPAAPVLANRGGLPNPIPTTALGNFRVNVVWAIGNLMVLSNANQLNGFSVLDISDPLNPTLLHADTSTSVGYSCYVAENRIYGCHSPARVWDIANPSAPTYLGTMPSSVSTGGYGALQDGHFIYGSSSHVLRISTGTGFPSKLVKAPEGFSGVDWDFAMPMGNMLWAGNDHGGGSGLLPHSTAPDTTPPAVTMVSPVNGASGCALSSRVGFVFSDMIDGQSLNGTNLILRPVAGAPVACTYSVNQGVVNIAPSAPLAPGTTYEVVVVAGGVKDYCGNGATGFTSTFTTVGGAPVPAIVVVPTAVSVPEGGTTTIGARLSAAPAGNVVVTVSRSSGDTDLTISGATTLTFTPANWQTVQTVTIAAAQDADAISGSAIVTWTAPGYTADQVTVSEADDDAQTVIWTSASMIVPEGGSAINGVRLSAQPAGPVTVTLARLSGDSDITVLPATLTFTTANWNTAQNVTLSAAWDIDVTAGSAIITGSAPGWTTGQLSVSENEDAGGAPPTIASLSGPATAAVGVVVTLTVSASDADTTRLTYSWNWGDGTPVETTTNPTHTHTYAQPGHMQVSLVVSDGVSSATAFHRITIFQTLTAAPARNSSSIVLHQARGEVWCVNTDAGTITAISASTRTKLREATVGALPRSLAVAADGALWVTNQGSDSISIVNPANGSITNTVTLPRGSAPVGLVISANGSTAYVACKGDHRVRAIATSTRVISSSSVAMTAPQALTISGDGSRLFVTRFISPDTAGEVVEIATSGMTTTRTIALAMDPGPDTDNSSRGLPNYLAGISLSPDGKTAWVSAKKDNIQRGMFREGTALDFQSTVRTISALISIAPGSAQEQLSWRIDHDNADQASATVFSPLGDWAFVALQGVNAVAVVDTALLQPVFRIANVGLAPQGLCLDASGNTLFVQNFMSRSISAFDLTALQSSGSLTAPLLGTTSTVAVETLTPQVLAGKQMFYNAGDTRMSRDGYLSCASCHNEGGQDGRVWDFTDRGEGLRNTIDLRGRRGMGHGFVHWSANFDEIQDFEHDIRTAFGGSGFMSDTAFAAASTPLGPTKAGRSTELDQLAAYVASLNSVGRSPHRQADGTMTAAAVRGMAVFAAQGCATCHSGSDFTDSAVGMRHNIGTITAGSGKRLNATLDGIDSPTLRGLWAGAPYLHHGGAATLDAVFTIGASNGPHTKVTALSAGDQADLKAYLLQLDESIDLVMSTTALSVLEASSATLTVKLSAQPAGNTTVTVVKAAGDVDLTVSAGATLTFTPANWNTAQTVTLAAAADADASNGSATFTASAPGMTPITVTATEIDDDAVNLVVAPTNVSVPEAGSATFTVTLSAQPAGNTTVTVVKAAGDVDLAVSAGATLTFTPANWNTAQTVTLAAAADADASNGSATFTVSAPGMTSVTVTATEIDDDAVNLIASPTALSVPEAGSATFTVKLSAQPAGNTTVTVVKAAGDVDLTLSAGATLTFTPANWNTAQTVTLAAAADVDTSNGSATFTVSAPGLTSVTVTATEIDDDTASNTLTTLHAVLSGPLPNPDSAVQSVTVNGTAATIDRVAKTWTATVTLSPGLNTVTVIYVATDASTRTRTFQITR